MDTPAAASASVFETSVAFLKGMGPKRAEVLAKELGIYTVGQLLQYYPYRYEDRTTIRSIKSLNDVDEGAAVQIVGTLSDVEMVGSNAQMRISAKLSDGTGSIDLVFFHGLRFVQPRLKSITQALAYGRLQSFNGRWSMIHPELEVFDRNVVQAKGLEAYYNTTEYMKLRKLESRALRGLVAEALALVHGRVEEALPRLAYERHTLIPREVALQAIHKPADAQQLEQARFRLKYEELFAMQVQMLDARSRHKAPSHSPILKPGPLVKKFLTDILPFQLTEAQQKVLSEIGQDIATPHQMNRLLQGDVGSGKTVVAFISVLTALDNGYQGAIMAPTEILAEQHFSGFATWADALGIKIAKLTGSVAARVRKPMLAALASGDVQILVGTHALIEDTVVFHRLGMCVIDEQHRFGVAQRARLGAKAGSHPPHMLIMTATPIPRTLSMTLYGDLDVSIIDQLPAGRKPITTVHRYDTDKQKIYEFIRQEVDKGRQCYIVYPLIEESEKLDLKNLEEGLEQAKRQFPDFTVSAVHGRMAWAEREVEMQAFLRNEAQIMVATTVIEVGINVPNASIMLIESAERFGLSQLHQLRGRVGRGAEQSYCILVTKSSLSQDSRERIKTMVSTTDGFKISEKDLELRGAGDLIGTKQSGVITFKLADLTTDGPLLTLARADAEQTLAAMHQARAILSDRPWYQTLRKLGLLKASYLKVG